jgi:hypothetical protein
MSNDTTPPRALQDQEAALRNKGADAAGIDRNEEVHAGVGIEDDRSAADDGHLAADDGRNDDGAAPRAPLIHMSPADQKRAEMAARLRGGREADPVTPFNGDMNDPEMLYGEYGRSTAVPDPDVPLPGVPAPAKRVLKVRGREVAMTEDEILAAAMKVTSADSYLAEARAMLEEAKAVRAERDGRAPPQHRERAETTQDDELEQPQQTEGRRHGLRDVVEQLQYGDTEEAAKALDDLLTERTASAAQKNNLDRLKAADLAASQSHLRTFAGANPEIANDKRLSKLLELEVYDVYRDDLVNLGLDETVIPTDPNVLAFWHQHYRINGYEVRRVPDILAEAKNRISDFVPRAAPRREERPRTPDRVVVDVDRTARRQNIPTQPTRAAIPPAAPSSDASRRKSTDELVAQMRRARGFH